MSSSPIDKGPVGPVRISAAATNLGGSSIDERVAAVAHAAFLSAPPSSISHSAHQIQAVKQGEATAVPSLLSVSKAAQKSLLPPPERGEAEPLEGAPYAGAGTGAALAGVIPPGRKVSVKDDGDCLYHSLQNGMKDFQEYLTKRGFIKEIPSVKELREEISRTMAQMLKDDPEMPLFFEGVIANANDQIDVQIEEVEANKAFMASEGFLTPADEAHIASDIARLESSKISSAEDYINRVKNTAFWGGEIEARAFAERFGMNVKIFEQTSTGSIVDRGLPSLTSHVKSAPTIYLVASARHYDYYKPDVLQMPPPRPPAPIRKDESAVPNLSWMTPGAASSRAVPSAAKRPAASVRKEESSPALPEWLKKAAPPVAVKPSSDEPKREGGSLKPPSSLTTSSYPSSVAAPKYPPVGGAGAESKLPPLREGAVISIDKTGDNLFEAFDYGLKENLEYLRTQGLVTGAGSITLRFIRKEIADTLAEFAGSIIYKDMYREAIAEANAPIERQIDSLLETRRALGDLVEREIIDNLDEQIRALRTLLINSPYEYNELVKGQGFLGGELELLAFAKHFNINVKILKRGARGMEEEGTLYEANREALSVSGITPPTIYLVKSGKYYEYFRPK